MPVFTCPICPPVPGFLHVFLSVCQATATDGLILQEQAERKEEPPNTYAWWKQLFTIRQLFTFPAYWMSSGGYRSFAECIISRWTSRLALILGNGRNVESTVETHISMKQLLSLLKNWACVDIYCRVPSVCVSRCLHAHTSINTYCMWVLHTGGYVISMNLSVY